MLEKASVRVPASTSNLGAGFDTLGMAVGRFLTASYAPAGGRLLLRRSGTLAELDVGPEDDLVRTSFLGELARRGASDAGGVLEVHSEIPVGRGLGTSAAAIVAGLLLASGATGDVDPDRTTLLERAAELEGHGDNAAPALMGGLVAVTPSAEGGVRALPLRLSRRVSFAFAAPALRISTEAARRALPESVPHRTAVRALGRLASLLDGLARADAASIAAGFEDELHVPHRLALIPGAEKAMAAAREAGAWGATLSGSGSGVIAACRASDRETVGSAMAAALRHAGHDEVVFFPLRPERDGARLRVGAAAAGESR